MDFQQQSSRPEFLLDTAAASVLSAWESSQRPLPIHRPAVPYNGVPISPISPSSSSSSSDNSMPLTGGNPWRPTSVTELELLQLRRGMIAVGEAIAERDPTLPAAAANQQPFFNFDFSLPHIPHLSLQPPLSHLHNNLNLSLNLDYQQQQQRSTPPLPTPTTPTSSSSLFASPPVTPENNMSYRRDSPSATSASGTKRSSDDSDSISSITSGTKKPRSCMSVKDFVPPDVTGLSKREARLVKNRAAAFLSRQRKREEFEMMELRVAELERENARLREMADGASPAPAPSTDSTELEFLRMQLAASRQREAELVHRLEVLKHEQQKIKTEVSEPTLNDGASSASNSPLMSAGSPLKSIIANPKGSASLGLMVLLCALPSLLSQPSSHPRSTLPTSQSFLDTIQWDGPSIFQTSASATIDEVPSWELDFSGANISSMDMDVDYGSVQNAKEEPEWQKLDLGLDDNEDSGLADLGLGSLDISFATTRTKDGKIRVRVHSSPTSSTTSSDSVPQLKTEDVSPNLTSDSGLVPFSLPSPARSQSPSASGSAFSLDEGTMNKHSPLSLSLIDSDPLGPFLGAGSSPTSGAFDLGTPFDFSTGSGSGLTLAGTTQTGERRRVRIALRSLPQPGGEGGEWEIEVR